jgi:hypothetical protein
MVASGLQRICSVGRRGVANGDWQMGRAESAVMRRSAETRGVRLDQKV